MTVDYRILEYKSITPISEVGLYSSAPLTLDIRGKDFKNISEVLINGQRAAEFIVLSASRILAQVPRAQVNAQIRRVQVLTADGDTANLRSSVSLRAKHNGGPAEGRLRMVQSYLKRLFTTPGRDIWRPGDGGGLKSVVGIADSPASLRARATTAISTTTSQEIRAQSQISTLASDERLRSATLLQVDFDPRIATLVLRLRLTSVDGVSTDAGLIL